MAESFICARGSYDASSDDDVSPYDAFYDAGLS